MFAGHFAPALAAKARFPELALWKLFLACQAVDLLFDVLVPLGVEIIELKGERGPLAIELQWMPWSHSLVVVLLYASACAGVGALAGRPREGLVLGAVLGSHWPLDLLVHAPDMPLWWGEPCLGLGL